MPASSAPRRLSRSVGRYVARHHLALLALVLATSGTAMAATTIARNSVGSPQLKAGAVTAPKLGANSVTGAKVAPNTLTGLDINEALLGTVPRAAAATAATTATSAGTAGTATNAGHATAADTASNAGHASTADTATEATHAASATNATTFGGVPASSYALATGTTQWPVSLLDLFANAGNAFVGHSNVTNAVLGLSSGSGLSDFPLDVTAPRQLLGVTQRVEDVNVCFFVAGGASVNGLQLDERTAAGSNTIIGTDSTVRAQTTNACVALAPTQQIGATSNMSLIIEANLPDTFARVYVNKVYLDLVPA